MLYIAHAVLYTLYFMLGACIFSFVAVVAGRLPQKQSPFTGRSRCDTCGHTLGAQELVPVFSYLLLRGKCTACGAKIPRTCLFSELAGGACMACSAAVFGGINAKSLFSMLVLCILGVITLMDIDIMEIRDTFVIALAASGVVSVWLFSEISLTQRIIGVFCVSVPMLIIALVIPNGFGGGDIKLMAAAGLLLGWRGVVLAMFLAILSGGVYAVGLMIKGKGSKAQFAFGPFLALGIAVSLLWGQPIVAWYTTLLV